MNVDRQADVTFACGATGSGKSFELKARLSQARPARLLVVDPDSEYVDCGYLHDTLASLEQAVSYSTFRTRYKPSFIRSIAEREFAHVCSLVRRHCDPEMPGFPGVPKGPVTLLVDELADFVGPSFRQSPASWQWLIGRGRKHGVTLLAASRRPAEIDKGIFENATRLRIGRLNYSETQRELAGAVGVPLDLIRSLRGHDHIIADKLTGDLSGVVGGRPWRPAGSQKPASA